MNYDKLFIQLNTEQSLKNRSAILSFLRYCNVELKTGKTHPEHIAYSIAGLMATDYARTLPEDDPISTILAIAGELEVNDPADKDELKNELITAIDSIDA